MLWPLLMFAHVSEALHAILLGAILSNAGDLAPVATHAEAVRKVHAGGCRTLLVVNRQSLRVHHHNFLDLMQNLFTSNWVTILHAGRSFHGARGGILCERL